MRLRFIITEVFRGLRRNASMALSVSLVTFVSLSFVGAAALIQTQINNLKDDWYGKVEVSIFLCPDNSREAQCSAGLATAEQEDTIRSVLEDGAIAHLVDEVYYESREEAYENYKKYDDQGLVQYLSPELMQASFRVKLSDPEQFATVADAVALMGGVDRVYDQREIFAELFQLLNAATYVSVAVAGVMLLAAVLLITTTIRLSALSRKRETSIMRMVGASKTMIQMPFTLEGAVAACFGAVLAIGTLWFTVKFLIGDWLKTSVGWVEYVDTADVWSVAPWLVLIAFGLAALASLVTLGKYTRA